MSVLLISSQSMVVNIMFMSGCAADLQSLLGGGWALRDAPTPDKTCAMPAAHVMAELPELSKPRYHVTANCCYGLCVMTRV